MFVEQHVTGYRLHQCVWFREKDNEHTANPPQFLGIQVRNVEGDTPYAFFMELFPEKILLHN